MRLLAALTAILVSVLALTGCGFQRAGPLKDTLRINLGSEPPSLDWHSYRKADHLLCKEEAAVACLFNATENIMCKPWMLGATDSSRH